jgi:hypothetical protein
MEGVQFIWYVSMFCFACIHICSLSSYNLFCTYKYLFFEFLQFAPQVYIVVPLVIYHIKYVILIQKYEFKKFVKIYLSRFCLKLSLSEV